jgi:AmmeMemoRadiSam system protein A
MHSPDGSAAPGTRLLRLARSSIEHGLVHGQPLPIDLAALPESFADPGATFTTLRLEGELRGCCGTLEAKEPLATNVARSAFRAAFHDPRFAPVSEDECEALELEVSVLTAMEPVCFADEAGLLECLTPHEDGLVIIADGRRATFLPKVWESLPDPQQFVAALKAKCGLPADYWSERVKFLRYGTTTYAESDQPGGSRLPETGGADA